MRECIECKRELQEGMFYDNWRHKVNVCKDCKREQQRKYRKINPSKYISRLSRAEMNIKRLELKVSRLEKEREVR